MKRANLILLALALLLGAFLLYSFTGSSNVEKSNNTDREDKDTTTFVEDSDPLTVEYTDKGYVPKVLRVNNGDTVTFINRSSRSMWVASDEHPVHTLYPEFDQKGLARNGESYSFTFDQTGSWEYHDHINPGATGTIVVEN